MFLGYVQLGYVKNIDNESNVLYVEELYLHPWFIHLICMPENLHGISRRSLCSEEIVKQKQRIFQIGTILGLETWCAYDMWLFLDIYERWTWS